MFGESLRNPAKQHASIQMTADFGVIVERRVDQAGERERDEKGSAIRDVTWVGESPSVRHSSQNIATRRTNSWDAELHRFQQVLRCADVASASRPFRAHSFSYAAMNRRSHAGCGMSLHAVEDSR